MAFDFEKFKALVHYICYKTDKDNLGATKLNKMLWYADTWAYILHGTPITGETYIKRQFGPVPQHVLPAQQDLVDAGRIFVRDAAFHGYEKREYVALRKPYLSLFSADEIHMIDELIGTICHGHTARSISEKTHDRIWELAAIGEEIPYYTVFAASMGEIDEEDIAWARQSIAEDAAV